MMHRRYICNRNIVPTKRRVNRSIINDFVNRWFKSRRTVFDRSKSVCAGHLSNNEKRLNDVLKICLNTHVLAWQNKHQKFEESSAPTEKQYNTQGHLMKSVIMFQISLVHNDYVIKAMLQLACTH